MNEHDDDQAIGDASDGCGEGPAGETDELEYCTFYHCPGDCGQIHFGGKMVEVRMTPKDQLPPLPPAAQQAQEPSVPHLFEFWWEAHMPQSTQAEAWSAWQSAQSSNNVAVGAQAQEQVAAVLGDIVALWDLYAPSQHMTAMHMQAKLALAGQQPVSPDMARWCAYVGGMVAHWVTSEPDARERLGDDKFEAAIAGIIERRLWAMPKRDTTTQPQPAPLAGEVTDDIVRETIKAIQDPDTVDAFHNGYYTLTPEELRRAVLALHPQAVPMTPDHIWANDGIMSANGIIGFKFDAVIRIVRAVEAHHGITAKAEGGA